MKKIILIALILLQTGLFAQTTSISVVNNKLKLNTVSQGVSSDSLLVRGSDKVVKFVPVSMLKSSGVLKTTISGIRLLSGTLPNNNFYTTNLGQEGNWYYDSTDTTSADNTGTVLVTSDGKRIKRVLTNEINAKWFGAAGDGITDDSSFIQSAINIACSLEKKLYLPKGNYLINTTITATGALTMYGDGKASDSDRGITRLVTNSITQNAFIIDNNGKNVYLHDFSIENLTTSVSTNSIGLWIKKANNSNIERLSFINYFDNLYLSGGIYYKIMNSSFFDPVNSGVSIENTYNSDIGDMTFNGNEFLPRFFNTRAPTCALLWKSGGGLRFVNNKVNWSGNVKFIRGLVFKPNAGVNTSVFLINSNSLENTTSDMIYFGGIHLANTVDYSLGKIIITGNELGLVGGRGIKFEFFNRNVAGKSAYYVSGVDISGNYISGLSAFDIYGLDSVNIGSNQYSISQGLVRFTGCNNFSYNPGNVTLLPNPSGIKLFDQNINATRLDKGNLLFDFTSGLPTSIDSYNWKSLFSINVFAGRGVYIELLLTGFIEGSSLPFSQTIKRYLNKTSDGDIITITPLDSDFIFSDNMELRVNSVADRITIDVKNKITSGTSNNGNLRLKVIGIPQTITQFNAN